MVTSRLLGTHKSITVFTKAYEYTVFKRRPWFNLSHLPRAVLFTLLTLWMLGLHFYPDEGGNTLLWNTSKLLPDYTAPRRHSCLQYRYDLNSYKFDELWMARNRVCFLGWCGVWDWVHLVSRPLFGLLYQPRSSRWDENRQGKPKYSEKTCPSATLSTTNPTWPGLEPATNHLSCGTGKMVGHFTKLSASKLYN
jgi:hypothetical protein